MSINNSSIFIIAEAGVNHNGNADMAFQLVDAAIEAGADAVKFQTFKAKNLVTKNAAKASYQKKTTSAEESQFEMLKRLELSEKLHHELISYCKNKNIQFLSTAFDHESLNFLVNDLKIDRLKIPSGEITNAPLLLAHAKTNKNLIVSTGMATLGEIEEALSVLAFGLVSDNEPSRQAFQAAYFSDKGQQALKEKITLLHCTTEYPAPPADINMKAMSSMSNAFGLSVGYSDHSEGIVVPIVAASMGAALIEKHFTLDKTLPGPDHKASLEPNELKAMIEAIRIVEVVVGDGRKCPKASEIDNRHVVRKSIVAAQKIDKGELFTENNLAVKRPGYGRSPMQYWDLVGTESLSSFDVDEIIK
jgi:N-acetylneuraminate synthase